MTEDKHIISIYEEDMISVVSSQIERMAYDKNNKILYVQFHQGKRDETPSLYYYKSVPPELYKKMLGIHEGKIRDKDEEPLSLGSFFIQNIRKFPNNYPYSKLDFEELKARPKEISTIDDNYYKRYGELDNVQDLDSDFIF